MAKVIIALGLGYGDEGKGSCVDFLCREQGAKLVVRFNGGAQAGHNVCTDDGRHHTFSQFGSGTFVPGCRTHLSRFMLVNPITMVSEEKHLVSLGVTDSYARMTVEREALVTTPFHVAANRLLEIARTRRHGSCGMGIGQTMADALAEPQKVLRIGDLEDTSAMQEKLLGAQRRMRELVQPLVELVNDARRDRSHDFEARFQNEWEILCDSTVIDQCIDHYKRFLSRVRFVNNDYLAAAMQDSLTVFEGAQGVLLDQDYGFQPYTTWTDCTFGNANKLLAGFQGEVERLGVLRAYMTRHGAGPFVSENKAFDSCSANDHNSLGAWQGSFRSGAFDLVATEYALKTIGSVDGLVFTHVDRVGQLEATNGEFHLGGIPTCVAYDNLPRDVVALNIDFSPLHLHWKPPPVQYDTQKQLADALFHVKPRIEPILGTDTDYAQSLARILKVPLKITSHGPRASDKRRIQT